MLFFFFFFSLDDLDGDLNGSDSVITVCIPNFYTNQLVFESVIENLIILCSIWRLFSGNYMNSELQM